MTFSIFIDGYLDESISQTLHVLTHHFHGRFVFCFFFFLNGVFRINYIWQHLYIWLFLINNSKFSFEAHSLKKINALIQISCTCDEPLVLIVQSAMKHEPNNVVLEWRFYLHLFLVLFNECLQFVNSLKTNKGAN